MERTDEGLYLRCTFFTLHIYKYNLHQISEFAFHFKFSKSLISHEKEHYIERKMELEILCLHVIHICLTICKY